MTGRAGPASATKGVACAVAAAFGFALMGWFVHSARTALSGADLALWRGLVCCVLLLPFVWRRLPALVRPGGSWLWMRSLAGAGSVLCFFWTLQHTTLAAARALADMAPVFVCVLSWLASDEKPTAPQVLVIALMTGAAVSLDLGAVTSLSTATALVGIAGAFSASVAYVSLRKAALRFSNPLVVFTLGLGLVLAAPFAPGAELRWPPREALVPIAGVGILGLAAQLVFTRVFVYLSAPIAAALSVTALVFSVLLDAVLEGHVPAPSAAAAYGMIMLGAATLHVLEQRRLKRPVPPAPEATT